jgi:hypothetical protein
MPWLRCVLDPKVFVFVEYSVPGIVSRWLNLQELQSLMGAEVAWEYTQVATETKIVPTPGCIGYWERRWQVSLKLMPVSPPDAGLAEDRSEAESRSSLQGPQWQ